MFRYFGLAWDHRASDIEFEVSRLTLAIHGLSEEWRCVYDNSGLRVLCAGMQERANKVHALRQRGGVILGRLYGYRAQEFDEHDSEAVLRSSGRKLIADYWGSYVALLCDLTTSRKWIIKDPTGNLPCFTTFQNRVHVFFSCMAECARLAPLRFTINQQWVRARVAAGFLGADGNPLREVSEIFRGECIEVDSNAARRTFYWNPKSVCETSPIEDAAAAAEELRSTAKNCCNVLVKSHPSVVHRLSGGFDSSTVLACMSAADRKPDITCLTYFVRDGYSDERPWARLSAKAAGCRHIEQERNPRTDLRQILDTAPMFAPEILSTYIEGGPIERTLAAEHGASMVTNGDGGDALFGRHARGRAATEYVQRHGFTRKFIRVAEVVASQTDRSVWPIWWEAVHARLFRDSIGREREMVLAGRKLVSEKALSSVFQLQTYPHPWFRSLNYTPWELVHKLATLLYPPLFYDPFSRPEAPDPEPISPLCSQPLVELCLRIPTYVHLHDGRDRGLARTAFQYDLPKEIVQRQWKDRAPRYFEEMMHWNLGFLREILLGGQLVAEELLVRRRVEDALSDQPTTSECYASELLDHACLEAWLNSWRSVERRAAA